MEKKSLLKSILVVVMDMITYKLLGKMVEHYQFSEMLNNFACELIFATIAICSLFMLKRQNILKLTFNGFGEGLAVGAYNVTGIALGIISLAFNHQEITASRMNIILFALYTLFIGIAEECLFRGILQNAIQDYIGCTSCKDIQKGIVISGTVFGLMHFINILSEANPLSVAIQVAAAIPAGILMSTIYYRSRKNLWVCVVLHSLNDAVAFATTGMLSGNTAVECINTYSPIKLITIVLVFAIDIYILRNEKIESLMK